MSMAISMSDTSKTSPKIKIWLSVWLSFMLVLVSMLHIIELNTEHYVHRNELILIEFTLLLIVIALVISNFIFSLYYLINHNKKYLQQSLTCFLIAMTSFLLSILIDPETILHSI